MLLRFPRLLVSPVCDVSSHGCEKLSNPSTKGLIQQYSTRRGVVGSGELLSERSRHFFQVNHRTLYILTLSSRGERYLQPVTMSENGVSDGIVVGYFG